MSAMDPSKIVDRAPPRRTRKWTFSVLAPAIALADGCDLGVAEAGADPYGATFEVWPWRSSWTQEVSGFPPTWVV